MSPISPILSIAPLDVVPTVLTAAEAWGLVTLGEYNTIGNLTDHERVFPFCPILLYNSAEIVAAKAVVVLCVYRNTADRQPKYEPGLQPKGVCLGGNVDDELAHGNVRMNTFVPCPCCDDRNHRRVGCIRLLPHPINVLEHEKVRAFDRPVSRHLRH